MEIDADRHLSAVERSVTLLEREGQPASTVTLSRSYPTGIADLWDAVTNAERIPRWFLPVSGTLEPGGRYQLEGHAGGVITTCVPPSRLALTWEFGGDVSWVELRLSAAGTDRARLELSHTAHLSPHWTMYGPGAVGVGWELGLVGLALHVAQPDAARPDEAEFVASSAGRALIRGSSDGWRLAAVDAGEDPVAAGEAAARTAAFYTGESTEST